MFIETNDVNKWFFHSKNIYAINTQKNSKTQNFNFVDSKIV